MALTNITFRRIPSAKGAYSWSFNPDLHENQILLAQKTSSDYLLVQGYKDIAFSNDGREIQLDTFCAAELTLKTKDLEHARWLSLYVGGNGSASWVSDYLQKGIFRNTPGVHRAMDIVFTRGVIKSPHVYSAEQIWVGENAHKTLIDQMQAHTNLPIASGAILPLEYSPQVRVSPHAPLHLSR